MNEINSAKTSLNDQTKFRLNEINKIKNYFNSEIQERKIMSKKLSKYIAAFDCIVLSATSGGISIISFISVIGVPSGTLLFSLTIGIIKKLLKIKMPLTKIPLLGDILF